MLKITFAFMQGLQVAGFITSENGLPISLPN
jgi:hypothetical protein